VNNSINVIVPILAIIKQPGAWHMQTKRQIARRFVVIIHWPVVALQTKKISKNIL
jgi:hypothetical protein